MSRNRRRATLLLVFGCLAAAAHPPAIAGGSGAEVSTIAGDGTFGLNDGSGAAAHFLVPTGLAARADGAIYISDEAAQRIRLLTRDGVVRTVAGSGRLGPLGLSVVGGYRDGPALQARFDHPMGLAVGGDGALYIADSKNGAIRKLLRGVVTTVARKPQLLSPRALAFDGQGRLWIGDFGGGLRRLDPGGALSTVSLNDNDVVSISFSPDRDDPAILAATPQSFQIYHLNGSKRERLATEEIAETGAPLGHPSSIVSVGYRQAVFSDAYTNNIRFLRFPDPPFMVGAFGRPIAGDVRERGSGEGAFADGSLESARFYEPRGLAISNGMMLVADAGNRRIRRVALPEFRRPDTGARLDRPYDAAHFEIAFVGPSTTFWNTYGGDSICAVIERRLNASRRARVPVRCHTVRIDLGQPPQLLDYIRNYLSFRKIDLLILDDYPESAINGLGTGTASFRTTLDKMLAGFSGKPRLALLWQHPPQAFSSDESLAVREYYFKDEGVFPDETYTWREMMRQRVKSLPFPQYDSFSDFFEYEKSANHPPLYAGEFHMTARGNAFLANHLADFLLREGLVESKPVRSR
jgi:hypothetical protein